MKKIVIPAKRDGSTPTQAEKPRERRRLGLNYGGAAGDAGGEGQQP